MTPQEALARALRYIGPDEPNEATGYLVMAEAEQAIVALAALGYEVRPLTDCCHYRQTGIYCNRHYGYVPIEQAAEPGNLDANPSAAADLDVEALLRGPGFYDDPNAEGNDG